MKRLALDMSLAGIATLAFSITSVLGVVPLSSVQRTTSIAGAVPNKFIIEVADASQVPSKRSLHADVYESLRKRAIDFKVDREFKEDGLFTGASVTLTNPDDVAALGDTAGVIAVRPVIRIPPPNPVKKHVVQGKNDPQIPPDSESTHILTSVDKLHAQGILGKGIKIGIIDTGIDYTHPLLGGGIGPGKKVIGGFDLVGDAYDGTNTPVPDPDPLDQCNGHGTHVAGIIGADPQNDFNISGVAYQASITAYRVFGCEGSVTDDVLVDALLRGVREGQDILTMSLGGVDGWTESTSAVVSSRISASGRVVTIAAGNDGGFGSWYSSSPGNAIDAISCGSIENTVVPLQNATVHGVQHDPITYFETFPLNVTGELPVFATSTDTTVVDDACDPLPDSTPDLSGFVTVIRRGTCTFVQKLTNAAAKGAQVVFIYDNGGGFAGIDTGNFTQATLIQAADGEFLVEQFAAGANVTISFPQTGGSFNFPSSVGGLMSSFSSYGPTFDMFFKPAVSAPGGNILSTFPVPLGSFAVLSGTSMATPFIAGSSALILSVRGKNPVTARSVRNLLETTAQFVPSSHTDGDPLQTVSQQGAGLINAFDAVHTTTIVTPGELLLNDTTFFKGRQSFTITNNARQTKKFTLSHVPAGTAVSVTPGTIFAADGPVPLSTDFASVTFGRSSVTLLPLQSATITVNFSPPRNADASTFPVYSGFIQLTSGTERLHVSYLGVAAALKNKQVLDDTDEFFGVPLPALLNAQGDLQDTPTNYTFVNGDFPAVLSRLAFGTPLLQADLVTPDIQLDPTIKKRAPRPSGGTFNDVPIVGTLFQFEFIPRNADAADQADNGFNVNPLETPTLNNGTAIPSGSYRILIRALRVTGDRSKEEDFESWLSPVFGVFPQ